MIATESIQQGDPVILRFLQLRDMHAAYSKDGKKEVMIVRSLIKDIPRERLPKNYSAGSLTRQEVEDSTKLGISCLMEHAGIKDCSPEALDSLVQVVHAKLSTMCNQFAFSKNRRSEKRMTAFMSPIQHTLCLNGIQNVVDLRSFYDARFRSPYLKLKDKWNSILGRNTGDVPSTKPMVAVNDGKEEVSAKSGEEDKTPRVAKRKAPKEEDGLKTKKQRVSKGAARK